MSIEVSSFAVGQSGQLEDFIGDRIFSFCAVLGVDFVNCPGRLGVIFVAF